jgi:hypothetical protein
MEISLNIDTSPFSRFVRSVETALAQPTSNSDLRGGMEQAQELYLGDMHRQFVSNGQGGGDWAPLHPFTRAQRNRQGFPPAIPILKRYGLLENVLLDPSAPGRLHQVTNNSLIDGFGGPDVHPKYPDGSGGDVTIAQVAGFHQFGRGSMYRPILREPTADLLTRMTDPIVVGIRAMIRKSIGGGGPSNSNAIAV